LFGLDRISQYGGYADYIHFLETGKLA